MSHTEARCSQEEKRGGGGGQGGVRENSLHHLLSFSVNLKPKIESLLIKKEKLEEHALIKIEAHLNHHRCPLFPKQDGTIISVLQLLHVGVLSL